MKFLVHHLLQASADRAPDKEALVHGAQRLSYGEVAGLCSALAAGLRALGVARGDRVGILLEPGVDQVVSIMAASEAGGVFVPINAGLFPAQVAHIVADCAMTALITTGARARALVPELRRPSALRALVLQGGAEEALDAGDLDLDGIAVHGYDRLLAEPAARLADVCVSRDLAALLYTSGSTGSPKGVMVTHAQVLAGGSIVSDYLGITERERILAVLPFSFDAGLNQLVTAFQQGGTILPLSFTFAREIVGALYAERITGLAGVPTLWSLMVQSRSGLAKGAPEHLRYITNTGGHMPETVLAQLRTLLPRTDVVLMYGLTEAFRSTYLPPSELDERPGSMGKAIPDTEILVVRADGTLCPPGEVGELVHRGPTVSNGYWGRPDLTAQRLRPHPLRPAGDGVEELVCYSGDLVHQDADGYLYFVGRSDAMIKTSGYRVSPTEVEEVAMTSGLLNAAAAVGVTDDVLGQAIVLFVVPDDPATFVAQAVVDHCASGSPRYMVPQRIVAVERLPQTATGKVDYPKLRATASEGAGAGH